mgnify:CR=1 FL=1
MERWGIGGLEVGIFAAGLHIHRHIALALLERHLVGIGHLFANPARHVLGGGAEVEDLVHVAVVEFILHPLLDVGEVGDHAVVVELFGATVDGDDAIVPVGAVALALVVEVQLV